MRSARASFLQELQLLPKYTACFERLGLIARRSGSKGYSQKITCLHEAIDNNPDLAKAWVHSGGAGSINLQIAPIQEKLSAIFGAKVNQFNCELWTDRDHTALKLAIYNDAKAMINAGHDGHLQIWQQLASKLRELFVETDYSDFVVTTKSASCQVLSIPLGLPTLGYDDSDAAS